jgi:DNA-binding transcriptional MerR regulator
MTNLKTAAEVARDAGVSIATVSREVARGNLKPAWQGAGPSGLRLFHPRDVDKWIKTRSKAAS